MTTYNSANEMIWSDWRKLGFHYDWKDDPSRLVFSGSLTGLKRFVVHLDDYVSNPDNDMISEHDHYGPYWLKVMTWSCPLEIDDKNIRGTIPELTALRDELAANLKELSVGDSFTLDRHFREGITTPLIFQAKAADFDPASLDMYMITNS